MADELQVHKSVVKASINTEMNKNNKRFKGNDGQMVHMAHSSLFIAAEFKWQG